MKSGFQRDKLAQTGNSSSQMKVFCGTAENGIETGNHAKYANEIKNFFCEFVKSNSWKNCNLILVWVSMFATFLKTADGDFDYSAVYASLFFAAIICLNIWLLYGALKKGRIPIGAGRWGSPVIWIERNKNPLGYWIIFTLFCGVIALFIFAIYARCSGLW